MAYSVRTNKRVGQEGLKKLPVDAYEAITELDTLTKDVDALSVARMGFFP